ncbi:aa3-type cytochrome oxidase subunit II [Actinomadura madurae]|uniref:aa3-type cytochrome oxidase subunit II n=1 Tax=Actinomadura madurae TaxID=1993 RepID=UPI0020265FDA|nr:cytochrome c oxidase subunit II [Actinomadura madurae]MCP9954806.1 cytochrome c oxidase subunit II [Actinomadura madurae]MCP9971546.1 cytochrome c oxidase subunit II [Actinomadura madurae]MCP9984038.1 cytochrome c oxidase subunit II [Actinomadura madurae]MCQ0004394.1 cytochrome c oxidase subunit II [Actinomadura madurae]MCQ0020271.1 cytochrome c oxidase subunit II [Actinomadura madurae]
MRSRRALRSAGALALLALSATACSGSRLGMPEPISVQGERMLKLWQGSWIAAFAVGAVVWGLIIWAVLFHRKRSDDLPPQVRYNMPIEILYTAVPFVIIAVLFYFTARDENFVEKTTKNPQVVVDVTAFQWSWQFDYKEKDATGKEQTVASVVGQPVAPNGPAPAKPVMTIPSGETVRVRLHSNDVIHSFWVPALIYKKDVMPGYDNEFEFTANKLGTYEGRCAELCGVDHSRMLFQLKVVTPQEFDKYIADSKQALAAGGAR